MSNRNRLPFFAAGGIVALAFVTWAGVSLDGYRHEHRAERQHKAAYEAKSGNEQLDSCVVITRSGARVCRSDAPDPKGERRPADYDLRAQQEMAEWALGAFFASIAGVLIAGAGVVFVAWTLREQRRATNVAQRAFEEAERPLFFVSIGKSPFADLVPPKEISQQSLPPSLINKSYDDPDTRTYVSEYIDLKNVGTRPAFGVSCKVECGFEGDFRERGSITGLEEIGPGETPQTDASFASASAPIKTRLQAGEKLTITGVFIYEDALGVLRKRGFRFEAVLLPAMLVSMRDRIYTWKRITDKRWNYDERIEK